MWRTLKALKDLPCLLAIENLSPCVKNPVKLVIYWKEGPTSLQTWALVYPTLQNGKVLLTTTKRHLTTADSTQQVLTMREVTHNKPKKWYRKSTWLLCSSTQKNQSSWAGQLWPNKRKWAYTHGEAHKPICSKVMVTHTVPVKPLESERQSNWVRS